jgi:tyrosine-protein kinase Etk/Wzc
LELQLEYAEVDVIGQKARSELLTRQRAAALGELVSLNSQEVEITQLERQVEILEKRYRATTELVDQARIDGALESQNISNVNIVQPATYDSKAVAPRKKILLVFGVLVGALGALGIVMVSEYLDQTVISPEQAEAHLELPVLLTLPFDGAVRQSSQQRSKHA